MKWFSNWYEHTWRNEKLRQQTKDWLSSDKKVMNRYWRHKEKDQTRCDSHYWQSFEVLDIIKRADILSHFKFQRNIGILGFRTRSQRLLIIFEHRKLSFLCLKPRSFEMFFLFFLLRAQIQYILRSSEVKIIIFLYFIKEIKAENHYEYVPYIIPASLSVPFKCQVFSAIIICSTSVLFRLKTKQTF